MDEIHHLIAAAKSSCCNGNGAGAGADHGNTNTNTNTNGTTNNPLLRTLVVQMQRDVDGGEFTLEEMMVCLLVFLDLGKSSKLLSAFQELGLKAKTEDNGHIHGNANGNGMDAHLCRNGIMKLFRCFLLSISTCIHYDDSLEQQSCNGTNANANSDGSSSNNQPNVSPEFDSSSSSSSSSKGGGWTLSSQTRKDIQEIANYATDKVIEYTMNKMKTTTNEIDLDAIQVSFQMFGEWYNSGGFSLVPWLELLDLAKWDYAGRAAASAAAAEKAKGKHQARKPESSHHHKHHNNRGMEPILENYAISNVFNSPHPNAPMPVQHQQQQQQQHHGLPLPSSPPLSRTLATFEFAGKKEHSIRISEENLRMFQDLVDKTSLSRQSPNHIANILLGHSKQVSDPTIHGGGGATIMVLYRQDLRNVVRDLVPEAASTFSQQEMERFSTFFTIFFLSFARDASSHFGMDGVNAKELAVGFSFLCAGNKSQKLAETFEIMEESGMACLTQLKLLKYITSYLKMIVGISLLSSSQQINMQNTNALLDLNDYNGHGHIASLCHSAHVGSRWILDDFLRKHNANNQSNPDCADKITFEDFASWYTDGGYNIAPWLEFLDHKKFICLLDGNEHGGTAASVNASAKLPSFTSPPAPPMNPPTSSGKIRSFDEFVAGSPSPHPRRKTPRSGAPQSGAAPDSKDVLSTFPLSNGRNLIVLREDAAYVRAVVEQLGLRPSTPESVWLKLISHSKKNTPAPLPYHKAPLHKSGSEKARDVDQNTFVAGVLKSIPAKCRKKQSAPPLPPTLQDTLKFFFMSFDMNEVDRVAANQLMGGLTLLCGGTKTSKLSFAFGLFDGRPEDTKKKKKKTTEDVKSLCGKELFYFLRSILIVLFSCCKQSLDLTAGPVGRYIADAANMVTDNAMKYQLRTRKVQRINFDEFGEWYNEGGFEIAPWLELLDLNKWVFLDQAQAEKMMTEAKPMKAGLKPSLKDTTNNQVPDNEHIPSPKKEGLQTEFFGTCPPPPPDDDVFFGDDMGEMDDNFDSLFNEAHMAKENVLMDISISEPSEPLPIQKAIYLQPQAPVPLTFRMTTNNNTHHIVLVSPHRVEVLKSIILESGMHEISIDTLCQELLGAKNGTTISKQQFDSSIEAILQSQRRKKMPKRTEQIFYALLASIYNEFDIKKIGKADACELACGLTVLCGGRKSDKLEYAFELLDREKKGLVSRFQMVRYLQSFLTVLLHISSCQLGNEPAEDILSSAPGAETTHWDARVIGYVSSWATEQVFKATPKNKKETVDGTECINFDNFADWYTKGGYNSIAWLELLDLKKWILSNP